MPFLNVIKGLFLKGSGPNAPSSVAATANSIGAVSTAPGFLSGSFTLFANSGLARVPIISGDPTFQQLTLTINASGASPGAASFQVEVTNDPSSQWNFPTYVYRQGDAVGTALNNYLVPTNTIAYANGRSSTYVFGIAGYSYVRLRVITNSFVASIPVLHNWLATTTAAIVPAATTNGIVSVDANTAVGIVDPVSSPAILGIGSFVVSSAPGTALWNAVRTPNKFLTASVTNFGNTAVWTPASGKKFRLMRYQLELTENATLAVAAVLTVKFQDATTDFGFQHDIFVAAAAGAVSGEAWRSGWIDIGNGYISALANNVLNLNISGAANLTAGSFRANVCGTEE